MKSYNSFLKRMMIGWGVVGIAVAALIIGNNASAKEKIFFPADLIGGECGTGNLTVSIAGDHFHVPCANVDTHTGEAYLEYDTCYGYGYGHCYLYRVHMQLPVLKIKKIAYKNGRVVTVHESDDFHINVRNRPSSYHKTLSLKSKQQRSLIVRSGHYTIYEAAGGYDESIQCGHAGSSDTGSITVGVHPGSVIDCTVKNEYRIPVRPPTYQASTLPTHCAVSGYRSLGAARAAYSHQCHVPRVDCDPVYGGWTCSSEQIGARSGTSGNARQWSQSSTVIVR